MFGIPSSAVSLVIEFYLPKLQYQYNTRLSGHSHEQNKLGE